jgi:hypothetical protein
VKGVICLVGTTRSTRRSIGLALLANHRPAAACPEAAMAAPVGSAKLAIRKKNASTRNKVVVMTRPFSHV